MTLLRRLVPLTLLLVCGASFAGSVETALVKGRGDPPWLERHAVLSPSLPPEDECAAVVKSESPGVEKPPTPPSEPTPGPETAGMLQVDATPNAPNAQLPDEIRTRLGFGAPFDVTTVPLEPLRGTPGDLAKVHAVLEKAARREGITRLSFWGASHVAGEWFTGEIRRILQNRYGDGGHGFVMPAAPWKGYRGTDINLCTGGTWTSDYHNRQGGRDDGQFGPGGISVEAMAPTSYGWVQTTRTNPLGRTVSSYTLLFLRQPTGGAVDVHIDDSEPVRVQTRGPQGPGAAAFDLPPGPHRFAVSPAGDGPVRLFGSWMEAPGPGVVVDAMGVTGRTATSWLAWDADLQAAYLGIRPVDLAVLAYGTNEANDRGLTEDEYRANLRKVLTRMRKVLPDAACVLIGPSDRARKISGSTYAIWSRTEWVARVQREVGPEFGCVTWDLQAATGGPGSMIRWRGAEPRLGADDGIHFSAAGYQELATRFVAALDQLGK